MKKRKLGALKLHRETLRSLNDPLLGRAAGGIERDSENLVICPASGARTECHTAVDCGTSGFGGCGSEYPACTPMTTTAPTGATC